MITRKKLKKSLKNIDDTRVKDLLEAYADYKTAHQHAANINKLETEIDDSLHEVFVLEHEIEELNDGIEYETDQINMCISQISRIREIIINLFDQSSKIHNILDHFNDSEDPVILGVIDCLKSHYNIPYKSDTYESLQADIKLYDKEILEHEEQSNSLLSQVNEKQALVNKEQQKIIDARNKILTIKKKD